MSTDWGKISNLVNNEDFFHKYLIHPEVKRLLGDVKGKVGADIGCGAGILVSQLLKEKGVSKMYAVDINEEMLAQARFNNKDLEVEYILADVTNSIPLRDNSYDFVTQLMLYHTIEKIEVCIAETFRILKEGGELVVAMPHPLAMSKGYFISLQDFDTDEYIHEQKVTFMWERKDTKAAMNFYSRPLDAYINRFISAGFNLAEMSEPAINSEARGIKREEKFALMQKTPWFLFLKFVKNSE